MQFFKRVLTGLIVAGVIVFGLLAYFDFFTPAKPRVSIITSVWNGDEFIEGFLEDITKQTIFSDCELIMINANSPGHEEEVIQKYMKRFPNIIYTKLPQDPGLYGVWNRAIKMASADVVTNANLDDRSRYDALEIHLKALEANPDADLVYAGYYLTYYPNETFENNRHSWAVDPPEFSPREIAKCLPGPRPVWRKALHEKFGYFDESFVSAADWGMWVRAVSLGAVFKKVPEITTLFYSNPKGISTDQNEEKARQRDLEAQLIVNRYRHLWQ